MKRLWIVAAALSIASGVDAQLITELRIGEVEGDPRYLLANVRSGGVTATGEIVVATRADKQIRVYTRGGEFLTEFGKRGDGPGEFRGGWIRVGPDRIAVTSENNNGALIQFFDLNGKLVGKREGYRPPFYSTVLASHPAGWLLTTRQVGGYHFTPGSQFGVDTLSLDLVDRAGKPIRTVMRTPGTRVVKGSGTGEFATERVLFGGDATIGVDGSGRVYITDHEAYRISVFEPNGKPLRQMAREHRPLRITQSHLDSYATRSREYLARVRSTNIDAELKRVVEARLRAPRPTHFPALGSLYVSTDGSLWVERPDQQKDLVLPELQETWGFRVGEPVAITYDRFDANGRFLGSVELPPKFRPLQVTRDTVLGIQPDEDDVEFIVRYRVSGPPRNLE